MSIRIDCEKERMKDAGKIIWIGLADVVPCQGNHELGDSKGAYVKVVAPALSDSDFSEKVAEAFLSCDFLVKNLEDVQTFVDYLEKRSVPDDLKDLAKQAQVDESVLFGTFHAYDKDETLN
jgi:hypothetical protein